MGRGWYSFIRPDVTGYNEIPVTEKNGWIEGMIRKELNARSRRWRPAEINPLPSATAGSYRAVKLQCRPSLLDPTLADHQENFDEGSLLGHRKHPPLTASGQPHSRQSASLTCPLLRTSRSTISFGRLPCLSSSANTRQSRPEERDTSRRLTKF